MARGTVTGYPSRRRRTVLLLLWVLVNVLVLAIVGELLVRLSIRTNSFALGNPFHYAHPFCNDDYHRLRFQWKMAGALRSGKNVQHPVLGWVPIAEKAGFPASNRPPAAGPRIALFGDSFAAGVVPTRPYERIAGVLNEIIPQGQVTNYAVPGYGVDQVYLRFLQVVAESELPPHLAIVGILQDDIDRALERFREGPKPYFTIDDGELTLQGTPIEETPEEWLEQHPVAIKSFLLARIRRKLDKADSFFSECRREEKEAVTRRILEALAADAAQADIPLQVVLFYSAPQIRRESWREDFLISTMESLGLDYVDTKPLLLAHADGDPEKVSKFFFPFPNGHPNPDGNRVVAHALYQILKERYGWNADIRNVWSTTVEFGTAGNFGEFAVSGWGDHGKAFSWTTATQASVTAATPSPEIALVLYLETVHALRSAQDERVLEILANGVPVHEVPVRELPVGWRAEVTQIELPRRAIGDDGTTTVTLRLPRLLTQQEAGVGPDGTQRRGIAVKSISLRPVNPR